MKNKWLLFLLVMFTAFALAACTANENAGADPENGECKSANTTYDNDEEVGKVLHLNTRIEPSSFNPSIGFDEASYDPLNNLMEGLTRLNEEGVAEPATAEDFDVSDDGLTYTFHIRDD